MRDLWKISLAPLHSLRGNKSINAQLQVSMRHENKVHGFIRLPTVMRPTAQRRTLQPSSSILKTPPSCGRCLSYTLRGWSSMWFVKESMLLDIAHHAIKNFQSRLSPTCCGIPFTLGKFRTLETPRGLLKVFIRP